MESQLKSFVWPNLTHFRWDTVYTSRRGGRFVNLPPCGAAHNYTKTKASCCRQARRFFFKHIFVEPIYGFRCSFRSGFASLPPHGCCFWGGCFFNLDAGAASADSAPVPAAARGCAEALKKNQPNSAVELVHPSGAGVSKSVSFRLSVSAPPANRQQLPSEPTDSPPPSALGPPCAACGAQARAAQSLLGL